MKVNSEAGRNRAAVGDAFTGAVSTASHDLPHLIKSSNKCQTPSWNTFLKVTHEANLSYSLHNTQYATGITNLPLSQTFTHT